MTIDTRAEDVQSSNQEKVLQRKTVRLKLGKSVVVNSSFAMQIHMEREHVAGKYASHLTKIGIFAPKSTQVRFAGEESHGKGIDANNDEISYVIKAFVEGKSVLFVGDIKLTCLNRTAEGLTLEVASTLPITLDTKDSVDPANKSSVAGLLGSKTAEFPTNPA